MQYDRKALFFIGCTTLLLTMQGLSWGQSLDLVDIPPHISRSVAPNLLLSFDDSASMYRGFLPDSLRHGQQARLSAAKSSDYNILYYNPEVNYYPPKDHVGDFLPDADFFAALSNPFNTEHDGSFIKKNRGNVVNLAKEYWPRWNDSSGGDGVDASDIPIIAFDKSDRTRKGAAYYYRFDLSLNPEMCSGDDSQRYLLDACYVYVEVSTSSGVDGKDERQNFANWYQYYSLRILAAKTVLSHLFTAERMPLGVRVAKQTINLPLPVSGDIDKSVSGVRPFNLSERKSFYRWLFEIEQYDLTPLRAVEVNAGIFFSNFGASSSYRERPWNMSDSGGEVSCRLNHHLLVTDGIWNGDFPSSFAGNRNADNTVLALPDGAVYRPGEYSQYDGSDEKTLSDLAFANWSTDLRQNMPNNIRPYYVAGSQGLLASYWDKRNDPANWQHMVTHAISWGSDEHFRQGESSLEGISSDNELRKFSDLYYATRNSRGQFMNLSSVAVIEAPLDLFANNIAGNRQSIPMAAVNTTSTIHGEVVYQAKFDGINRSGDLQTHLFPGDGEAIWNVDEKNRNLKPHQRKVISYDPVLGQGIEFRWSSLSKRQQVIMDANDGLGEKRVGYIRGSDRYEEQREGSFKNRVSSVLGPIVNSEPLYIGNGFTASGAPLVVHPDDLEGDDAPSHRDFLCENRSGNDLNGQIEGCGSQGVFNRKAMLYVGSNDGMLHAYNAGLDGGREVFSYVPGAIVEKLPLLTSAESGYTATVDGKLEYADVYFADDNKGWQTILVGGLRTGGQGYYALNVTEPSKFNDMTKLAETVLWEFTDKNDVDLGYSFSKPVIVKSNYRKSVSSSNGRWVVIFGNGYNAIERDKYTGSGEASLFVVDAVTGELIKKINTGVGDQEYPNGMSTPGVIYNDADYRADYVYAGDLRGNMWKFDISSPDPEFWGAAYGSHTLEPQSPEYSPSPLFTAKIAGKFQPITSAPVIAGHPDGRDGLMVYFGTGKSLESVDHGSHQIQSFYALWDKNHCKENSNEIIYCADADVPLTHIKQPILRGELLSQKITQQNGDRRTGTNHEISWNDHLGWYIDLDYLAGERVLLQPSINGGLILFPTYIANEDACRGGGASWLMAVSKSNGGVPLFQPFDFNGDGFFDSNDYLSGQASFGKRFTDSLTSMTSIGCGGRPCIFTGDAIPINEGVRWGRWRWQMLTGD